VPPLEIVSRSVGQFDTLHSAVAKLHIVLFSINIIFLVHEANIIRILSAPRPSDADSDTIRSRRRSIAFYS
jgi:hypothetical protein